MNCLRCSLPCWGLRSASASSSRCVNSAKKKQQKKQAQQTLKQVKTAADCRLHEGHGDAGEDSAARKVCPDACGANEDAAGKMEQKQPQGSLHYVSHEGVELHEDGFHGQNRANRTDPADVIFAESGPRVTAEQMRNALIMKEILDAPVSRRGARGRRYGR